VQAALRTLGQEAIVMVNGVPGRNSTPFSGKVKGRALAAGRYRARIAATDASGKRSPVSTVSFRILRR
jgi:hypothetical protein